MHNMSNRILYLFFCGSIACIGNAGICSTPSVFVPASQSPTVFVPASPTAGNAKRQRAPNQNTQQNVHPDHVSQNNNYHNNNHGYYHRHYNHHNNSTVYVYPFAASETYVSAPIVTSDDDSYVRNVPDDMNRNQNANVNTQSQRSAPNGKWVDAQNGDVPDNALQYTDENNLQAEDGSTDTNVFYCRGVYNNNVVDGVLVPSEGCYIDDAVNAATIRLQHYQVLTNS
jgi:hypothetical protein